VYKIIALCWKSEVNQRLETKKRIAHQLPISPIKPNPGVNHRNCNFHVGGKVKYMQTATGKNQENIMDQASHILILHKNLKTYAYQGFENNIFVTEIIPDPGVIHIALST
jgi:hypothetical protein